MYIQPPTNGKCPNQDATIPLFRLQPHITNPDNTSSTLTTHNRIQPSITTNFQLPTLHHFQLPTHRLLHPPSATPLVNFAILISPIFLAGQRFDALDGDFRSPNTRVLKSDVSLPSLDSKLFGLPRNSSKPESRLRRSL
jgi:hypothetical protein